jgi:hypothetical protein
MCWTLTKQTRNDFLEGVSRSSLPAKLQGLMDSTSEVMIPEMEHQAMLKESHALLTFFLNVYSPLKLLLFLLAIVQNVLILVHYSSDDYGTTTVRTGLRLSESQLWSVSGHYVDGNRMEYAMMVIGLLILANSLMLCTMHMLQYGKLKMDSVNKKLEARNHTAITSQSYRNHIAIT